jgi:DNA modification methylase
MNQSIEIITQLVKESIIQGSAPNRANRKPFGFYWTRKNPSIAAHLIKNLTNSSSVILDPFMGSGTTFLDAAQKNQHHLFVGVELNELPIKNFLFSLGTFPDKYSQELEEIIKLMEEIGSLYRFRTIDGEIEITKIIHDKEDNYLVPSTFEVKAPGDSPKTQKVGRGDDLYESILEQYKKRIRSFPNRPNMTLETNSRIAIHAGMNVSDVFGPLGFEALSKFKQLCQTNELCRLLVAASLHLLRLTDAKSQSQFPYWHPKIHIHEKSAAVVLLKQLKKMHQVISELELFQPPTSTGSFEFWSETKMQTFLAVHGPISQVLDSAIPNNSVELVISDPPYFDQVAYSEYLKLWEFFTGFTANLEDEIVESSRLNAKKTRAQFLEDLRDAFKIVRAKMKDNAFALIYFKDSKPRNLHDFIECLEQAGLVYLSQVHLPNQKFTYKQNTSKENTVGGDSIMIFKAAETSTRVFSLPQGFTGSHEEYFLMLFKEYIKEHGPTSLSEALDNSLIFDLYPSGFLKEIRSNSRLFEIVSQEFDFDPLTRKWKPRTQ